jgi:hypothetical protein
MSLLKKASNPFTSEPDSSSVDMGGGKKKSSKLNKILFALIVISAGVAGYFYNQNNQITADPNKAAAEEIARVVAKVGKLMVLPNETPSMATVVDPKELSKEAFFAKANVGDKVILYPNARKVILYNPDQNRIIEVATLDIGKQQ